MVRTEVMDAPVAPAKTGLGEIKPALYSVTYIGLWYRGGALTMEQVLERAKRFGYDGLEIEAKRPHGFPLDWPAQRCQEFRARCNDAGEALRRARPQAIVARFGMRNKPKL